MSHNLRKRSIFWALAAITARPAWLSAEPQYPTLTPIHHLVVIFQENVSFDHYFATYPYATNPPGQPVFQFRSDIPVPAVNGLGQGLLSNNPNSAAPFRLDRSQSYTCDQDHGYTAEQKAFDHGLMDRFVEETGSGTGNCSYGKGKGLVMGYYDGNTVTALWNYAQYFAMSDNFFATTFGPSTPGALNLVSGSSALVDTEHEIGNVAASIAGSSVIGDPDPYYDDCGNPAQLAIIGQNIGDLLNGAGVTWGWFQGGFRPTGYVNGKPVCGSTSARLDGTVSTDYSAHHEPFQYYQQTANPHHLPPTSVAQIGYTDRANHQYDLLDFWRAVAARNIPAVTFLKATKAQDGHASSSSPLDEQTFIVSTINKLQETPEWSSMAVVIAYDDSDGWYDHVMSPLVNQSATSADALTGPNSCGAGSNPLGGIQGRCGYGPRLPLLIVSPWAKDGFVDHTLTDQSSILRFIEDNWLSSQRLNGSFDAIAGSLMNMFDFSQQRSQRRLFLYPDTGSVSQHVGSRASLTP